MRIIQISVLLAIILGHTSAKESVVLLHGLARTPSSMNRMDNALTKEGYHVINLGYDSRLYPIEALAKDIRARVQTQTKMATKVHFVTHSLGGIIVRQMQAAEPLPNIGRVVMLSPPNQGSEVVDRIGHWWLFGKINGPAGQQLGTVKDGFIDQLPPIDFDCGIITGDRSINWINSMMIPGKDDGKVSTRSSQVEGLASHKVVHLTHPMIMKRRIIIEDTVYFLKTGEFIDSD